MAIGGRVGKAVAKRVPVPDNVAEAIEDALDKAVSVQHSAVVKYIAKAQEKAVVVTFDHDIDAVPSNDCFENITLVDERTIEITYRKDKVNAGQVLAAVQREGLAIVDVRTREPDLEDVFLSLTSEQAT